MKNPPAVRETLVDSWAGKVPWRRKWQPAPLFLPGESQAQRSLAGYICGVTNRQGCVVYTDDGMKCGGGVLKKEKRDGVEEEGGEIQSRGEDWAPTAAFEAAYLPRASECRCPGGGRGLHLTANKRVSVPQHRT